MVVRTKGDRGHDIHERAADYVGTLMVALVLGLLPDPAPGLIVNRVSGRDDKWSASQAQNLTYCIDARSFSTAEYARVVAAMAEATASWEEAANVRFVHVQRLDHRCSRRTMAVVFNVRGVADTGDLVESFYPHMRRRQREVLIAHSAFGDLSPLTLTGVLRQKLGHTLGFRHEHTRPESNAPDCFEDLEWRALTEYDSASVMHDPECNGTNNGDLNLTNLDRQGAGQLYP